MFKVKNTIATREFLEEAFRCENEYYRGIIRDVMKHNPFANTYYIPESTILAAYQDEENICDEWAEKIKNQFRIEKDDEFFEFGKEYILTSTSSPLFIANYLLTPLDEYQHKCLIVSDQYELIVEEKKARNCTILKFKRKW